MDDVTVGGGEGAPGSNDDSRRIGRVAVGIGVGIAVLVVLWLLWPRFGVVPNVVGTDESAARVAVEKAGYHVGVVATRTVDTTEAGRVLMQVPPAGLRVALGQEVDFTIAEPSGVVSGATGGPPLAQSSAPTAGVVVPSLSGQVLTEASGRLQMVGLSWSTDYVASGMAAGQIIHQAPSAGVVVDAGTIVVLTISSGTASHGAASVGWNGAVVPEVLGMSAGTARSKLSAAGYGTRIVYAPSTTTGRGRVFWQSHGPGPDADDPTSVEIWVSTGVPSGGVTYETPPHKAPL